MRRLSPTPPTLPEFEIIEKDGMRVGTDGIVHAAVPDDGDSDMFKRNGIKVGVQGLVNGGAAEELGRAQWLVMELDGVRCYIYRAGHRMHVLLTHEDIYP